MRFRSKAARWIGNISGPNLSRRLVRLHAGWYGDSLCSAGTKDAPSEADLFLVCVLRSCEGRSAVNVTAGELRGVSPVGTCFGSPLAALFASQYCCSKSVSLRSLTSLLSRVSDMLLTSKLSLTRQCPLAALHASKRGPVAHSSGAQERQRQSCEHVSLPPPRKAH